MPKKAIIYLRISHQTQSFERQEQELKHYTYKPDIEQVEVIKETASGVVPFAERKAAHALTDPEVKYLIVHDFDRLGRDTVDILGTIKKLSDKGTCVIVKSLNIQTLNDDGTENYIATMLFAMLSIFSQIERKAMLSRQKAGIQAAREKGKFKGRKKGTSESPEKFLSKYPDIVEWLKIGTPVRAIIKITGRKHSTVAKASRIYREMKGIKKGKKIEPEKRE